MLIRQKGGDGMHPLKNMAYLDFFWDVQQKGGGSMRTVYAEHEESSEGFYLFLIQIIVLFTLAFAVAVAWLGPEISLPESMATFW